MRRPRRGYGVLTVVKKKAQLFKCHHRRAQLRARVSLGARASG